MTEKRFSIRLANGSTQTFDCASQLASWTQSQRELNKVPAPTKRRTDRRQNQRPRPTVQAVDGRLPLARFNRHHSFVDSMSE